MLTMLRLRTWASEGGQGRAWTPLDFENFSKKVFFLVSSGKKQILPLLASARKILEKSPCAAFLEKIFPTPMSM